MKILLTFGILFLLVPTGLVLAGCTIGDDGPRTTQSRQVAA